MWMSVSTQLYRSQDTSLFGQNRPCIEISGVPLSWARNASSPRALPPSLWQGTPSPTFLASPLWCMSALIEDIFSGWARKVSRWDSSLTQDYLEKKTVKSFSEEKQLKGIKRTIGNERLYYGFFVQVYLTCNSIWVISVQHSDLIFSYVTKWSP